MLNKSQLIALYTLVRRELIRMFRIFTQVFLPPIITTFLYFLIFGTLIGKRIGPIQGVSYLEFIAPGLILMAVITNSYGNVSTSLFSFRFQKSIEEMLVSPIQNSTLLLGYVLGGMLRGLIVGLLVFTTAYFFLDIDIHHLPLVMLVVLLVSALFALAGFTNGMIARNFDDVMIVPTFVLTPLTYLGGIFYSIHMLPDFWQTCSWFNPIMYMMSAMRYAMIGQTAEVNIGLAMSIIVGLVIGLTCLNLKLLKLGVGLRS
ncbi:MAG: ABC transporter permease [Legionellaceae bacterium]|nr:ABC transporter permease [Legionellaceae bacterium]HCA89993.1 ABC transporter permease [Legionellales bacterium]|tara:strand:- start:1087 stop:1863 length:777 start_codon:yes stop_codon:yes gene_type:complete